MNADRLTNHQLDRRVDRKHPFRLLCELEVTCRKDWLVRDLLGAGEASAWYGKPGDGKSVLVQDMGLHIAAGLDWHGRQVRKGSVLYLALERCRLVERRAIAFRLRSGLEDLPFAIMGGVYDLKNPRNVELVAGAADELALASEVPLALLIVDTLSRALAGGDENGPKDMGSIVNATGLLQERTRAHVLLVHHTPIDGADRLRGHGALLGAMDTTVNVVKSGAIRTATVVKANDSEEGAQVAFTLEPFVVGTDADGNETTAPVVVPARSEFVATSAPKLTKNQQTMFRILHAAGSSGLTTGQWNEKAREAGLGTSRKADLYDFREALRAKGIVREFGERWTAV